MKSLILKRYFTCYLKRMMFILELDDIQIV
jgi:hypothetical protein